MKPIANRLPANTETLLLTAASIACFVFAATCLALVTAPSENVWYFYAEMLLSGARLYSDLHLVLQPVFPILNAIGMSIFGHTYFGQRAIFLIVIALYVYYARKLTEKVNARGNVKALLFLAFFVCATHFEAYRFDDYHAFVGLLAIFVTLAAIESEWSVRSAAATGTVLGVITLTRINDGLALTIAILAIIVAKSRRTSFLKVAVAMTAITTVVISLLYFIGETPAVWLKTTIIDAMEAKGGNGLFFAPIELFKNSLNYLFDGATKREKYILLKLATISLIIYSSNSPKLSSFNPALHRISWTGGLLFCLYYVRVDLIPYETAGCFVSGVAFFAVKFIKIVATRNLRENLNGFVLAIPLSLYCAGAMSSGGQHFGLYFPMALFALTAALYAPRNYWTSVGGILAILISVQMVLSGFLYRFNNPYSWHSYRASALSDARIVVNTKAIGLVPFDKRTKDFILSVCNSMSEDENEMLSIPFPYANYICGKKLWKGYAQTFFDMTGPSVINRLVNDLASAPPRYVFYQRQLDNLEMHERLYNQGRPLAHRALDHFMMEKIDSGKWVVIYEKKSDRGSDWYLVDTTLGSLPKHRNGSPGNVDLNQ